MLSTIHVLCLIAIYLTLVIVVMSYFGPKRLKEEDGDDDGGGGGGGWDLPKDIPPIDLPPGIYVLPEDADDPSLVRKTQEEDVMC